MADRHHAERGRGCLPCRKILPHAHDARPLLEAPRFLRFLEQAEAAGALPGEALAPRKGLLRHEEVRDVLHAVRSRLESLLAQREDAPALAHALFAQAHRTDAPYLDGRLLDAEAVYLAGLYGRTAQVLQRLVQAVDVHGMLPLAADARLYQRGGLLGYPHALSRLPELAREPGRRRCRLLGADLQLDVYVRRWPALPVPLPELRRDLRLLRLAAVEHAGGALLRLREAQDHIGAARREGAQFPGEGLRGERRGRPLRGPHHGQRLPELRLLHRRGQALQRPGEYCSLAWRAHRPALAEIHRLRADARRAELEDASSAHGPRPAEAHKRITPLPHFCAHACPLSHELRSGAKDLQGFQPQLDRRAATQPSAGPPQKLALEVHVYRGRRVPTDFGDELLSGRDRMPEHLPQRGRSLLREGGERDRAGPHLAQLAQRHLAEAADPVQRAHRAVQRCRPAPHELRAALEVCLAGQAHGLALPVASADPTADC